MQFEPLQPESTNKAQIEQVQKKKHEYKLMGSYTLRKDRRLFQYNPKDGSVIEVSPIRGNLLHMVSIDGKLTAIDLEHAKCVANSNYIYFETLNLKNAQRRVDRYKKGLVKELYNLREKVETNIKIF